MKIKSFFQTSFQTTFTSIAILFLRLIVGIAFINHGWGKIQNPTSWLNGINNSVPGFLQFLAAISEFGGGIALVLGFLTRIAALGIGCTMAVAVFTHLFVLKDPFVNSKGGSSYEQALVFFGISILFLALGAGKFSIDRALFGTCSHGRLSSK